jgi:hypothetical protein
MGDRLPSIVDLALLRSGTNFQPHRADLQTQGSYDVIYLLYWVDGKHGKIFCLVEAPDPDTAATVHREAHGLVAEEIYEVQEGS